MRPAIFLLVFIVIGFVVVVASHAATLSIASEAETGTVQANATKISDTTASNGQAVRFGQMASGGGSSPCTNDLSCWPNATNTGYQNAPGYPGTKGVADLSKLTVASANSTTCPDTFQSNHTYSFCRFSGSTFVGNPNNILTNVHFIGSVFEDTNQTGEPDKNAVMVYCSNNCSFDYITIKPKAINAPDLPGHGTSYKNGYGVAMGVGWGDYGTVGHGVTITHSDIWGFGSGIILGANTAATPILIQDNWLHDQSNCPDGTCLYHSDGIGQVNTGASSSYITIDHNNMPFIQGNTNNIAFQEGTYDNLKITNNILSGDGYTVAIWGTSKNITFTGNVLTNYGQQYYGWLYPQTFWTTPGSTWAKNRFMWDPSGASPFYKDGPGLGNGTPVTSADTGKCWVPNGLSTTDLGGGGC